MNGAVGYAIIGAALLVGCGDGLEIALGAAPDAATTSPPMGFSNPQIVPTLPPVVGDDEKPTLPSDMLELYFLSTRAGGPGSGDVWRATRAQRSDAWSAPTLVSEVSTSYRETSPAVSSDGLTLWVGSDRPGGVGNLDIWVSTRATRSDSWGAPTAVSELNSPGDEIPRPPGGGGALMPMAYRLSLADGYQTYIATRLDPSRPWTAPAKLTEVDTSAIDVDGFLTSDALTIYFSSDRAVLGDQDLFVGGRVSASLPFGEFAPFSLLNTPATERDPWVSPDGAEMYFASNRSGAMRIYHAAR